MKLPRFVPPRSSFAGTFCITFLLTFGSFAAKTQAISADFDQVPTWSKEDRQYFLHGSMSTEVVPESVLRAFMKVYPDLFPTSDFSHLGMIPDADFGWPIGISRTNVPHLGNLPSLGVNCASCHVAEINAPGGVAPLRLLGVTSHFDSEGFFGAILAATYRTALPDNMQKFLAEWLAVNDPAGGDKAREALATAWQQQQEKITNAMSEAVQAQPPGGLCDIKEADLHLDSAALNTGIDLAALTKSTLALFHNIRASLHIPDQPPDKAPPMSGPGRNDAFGLLSAVLFGSPQPFAPVKYGLVWNLDQRHWVHWDGNTQSPLGRNLLAAMGLGAPLVGHHGQFDFAAIKRHTDLSERIHAPKYPFPIDQEAAKRGAATYDAKCASCHSGVEGDQRLHAPEEIGTEPQRAMLFTAAQAEKFDHFFAELESPGYTPPADPPIRSTQKYWAASLAGVWARAPYLHNGSVRTMQGLLAPASTRAASFHRGSQVYDTKQMGYIDEGPYLLDTTAPGNSKSGHEYGADLPPEQKRDLMEFLKTL